MTWISSVSCPPDSVSDLSVGRVVPESFTAVAHLAPGLRQLIRLPKLRHIHIEREGLTPPIFRFAAAMPALITLTGLDEFGDDGPMPPAQVDQVRTMRPHISLG